MENCTKNNYFIIFGGGGVRGLSYSGAYRALIENNIIPTGYAGSSIGALFAALISIGYSCNEIFEMLSDTGLKIFMDVNLGFRKEIGFSKGNLFLEWLREKIEEKFYGKDYKKGQMPPVKFKDINTKLVIYSVDLTTLELREFSFSKTPDFEIALAVRASVSMPGLFSPLDIEGHLVVDGDILKSAPLWRLSPTIRELDERVIEFRLEDNVGDKKITNSIEYINRVYNAITGFATEYVMDLYKEKDKFEYIKINTPDISVVDFLIPKDKKEMLYQIGYDTTMEYFREFYPKKKEKLKETYKKFLSYLEGFYRELGFGRGDKAYLRLCEMFVFLCEAKKYLDICLYNQLLDIREEFIKNYKRGFLGFSKIENKKNIEKALKSLIDCTKIKISECL